MPVGRDLRERRQPAGGKEHVATDRTMMRSDVYDQLKVRLFTGELRSGQFVSQRELTELLGTTLNPVREAIRKLEAEGLISVYAQRGIQIAEADPKSINDAYDYRLLLEICAVRHFIAVASREAVDVVVRGVEASLAAVESDPQRREVRLMAFERDYEFHKDLVDFQGNEIISKHYSLNAARLRLFRINIGEPLARVGVAAQEHIGILDACRKRNTDLAISRLTKHIEISREHTLGLRPMIPTAEGARRGRARK
jgi:DNA-binding GntR family transcriptional regulator